MVSQGKPVFSPHLWHSPPPSYRDGPAPWRWPPRFPPRLRSPEPLCPSSGPSQPEHCKLLPPETGSRATVSQKHSGGGGGGGGGSLAYLLPVSVSREFRPATPPLGPQVRLALIMCDSFVSLESLK